MMASSYRWRYQMGAAAARTWLQDQLNPDGHYWESKAKEAREAFDLSDISLDVYWAFRGYMEDDNGKVNKTWKEIFHIFTAALEAYTANPTISAESLAQAAGVLSDGAGVVAGAPAVVGDQSSS
jgi:hypothetical protein